MSVRYCGLWMKLTANTLTIVLIVYKQVCFIQSSQVARGCTVSSDVVRMMSMSSAMPMV